MLVAAAAFLSREADHSCLVVCDIGYVLPSSEPQWRSQPKLLGGGKSFV